MIFFKFRMVFRGLFLLFSFVVFSQAFSQDQEEDFSFNDKFNDANLLMDEKLYTIALPLWLDILKTDTNSSNWNYKVGICYLNSGIERSKSLPFLEKAVQKTAKNYNPFSSSEEKAPIDAFYYLAKSYLICNQIDNAVDYFNRFKDAAGKKHYLLPDVERNLEMCENARELLAKPVTVKISNIGGQINSSSPEYGALISLDEKALYFTSRRLWKDSSNADMKERNDGEYFEDIYVSYKDKSGKWQKPEMLNFNRPNDHEATVSISADGQTLYIYRDEDGNGNLYQSFFVDTSWTAPVPVGSDVNSKSHETHLTVTLDGKTLYFVSNRKGGLGEKDIFKCVKLPNGQWSMAQNLGPSINTPFDEDGPFIHPDGKTLFFSSRGHKSIGGYDIFLSKLSDDGTWSKPENLGYPINTTDDDIFFVLSPDGKRAYYSTFRNDGFGNKDLYMIEQPDAEEHSLTLIKGTISVPDRMTMPEEISIVITDNETGEFITEVRPLKRNGSFVFVIPPGKNYNISYIANGIEFYNENVYIPVGSEYKEVEKEFLLDPSKLGTSDAVKVNIISSTDKPRPQWKIRFTEPGFSIPDGSVIQYLNENGEVIYEERLAKSGFFAYHQLEKTQPYLFTLKVKDDLLCKKGEIVIMGKEDSAYRFLPDINCIFREHKDLRPRFVFSSLGKELPADMTIAYLDESGTILFEEKMDPKGYFSFRELPKDKPYIVQLKSSDRSFCGAGEIIVPGPGGVTYTLAPDDNCIYKVKEKKSYFSFSTLGKAIPAGLMVAYLSDDGTVIEESKVNQKGEFKFRELSPDKPYSLVLKTKDQSFCEQSEIFVPGPGGITYIMEADEKCVFRLKEKKSQFVFSKLDPARVENLLVQVVDDKGKLILEEKMDRQGNFSFNKIPPGKLYSFKIIPADPSIYKGNCILIPVQGNPKSFQMFSPDKDGLFRVAEAKDVKPLVSKLFFPNLKQDFSKGLSILILDENGNLIFEETMNERGEFTNERIPAGKTVFLKIKSEDSLNFKGAEIIMPALGNSFTLLTPDEAGLFRIQGVLDAQVVVQKEKETPVTETVHIEQTANFEYASSDLSDKYKNELDEIVKTMKGNPSVKVNISGHTDSKGTDEYNLALSKRRAQSTANYLLSKGIEKKRISSQGFGESIPLAPNIHPDGTDNPEGRQINRRVEIKSQK